MPSPHLPRLTIAKKGFLLISLPLATQLLFGLAVLVNGRNAVAAHAWELHSQEVLGRAYGVKTSLLAAQSNLRGYVLSANPDFRARSVLAGKEVPTSIAALSRLVADNPSQTLLVRQMDRTAIPFLKFQTDNMLLVDEHRQMDAEQRIAQGAGNDLMDRFLVPMNGFLAEEQRLAKARHARAYNSNQTAQVTVEGGMALNLGLAGTLAFFFITGINRRLRVLTDRWKRSPIPSRTTCARRYAPSTASRASSSKSTVRGSMRKGTVCSASSAGMPRRWRS